MQLIQHLNYLWLLICCLSCFGNCLSIDDQKSDQSINDLFSSTSTTKQQLISTTDMMNNLPSIFKRKLIRWKRSLSNLRRDLIDVEKTILDPNSSKEKLIKLHRKAFNDLEEIENRIFQYIKQLNAKKSTTIDKSVVTPVNQKSKIENNQIDQQLDSKIQAIESNYENQAKNSNFFFSSSTSKPQSQSVFWLLGASASSTDNSSTLNSGNLSSFANYSSNFNSSNSLNISSNLKLPIDSLYQSKTNELINTIPIDLNLANSKFINKSVLSDKKLINSSINRKHKKKRHSFLLFHKCSEGYVQINRTNYNLNTGMNLELLSNSELIINFLKKPNDHQLHIKTRNGKYLCFGENGKPNIMGELNNSLCTFKIIFHKNEYVQLISILNDDWALGFDKLGIPMKASQQKKRKNLQKTFPNPCTLFIRQRSDNQLLQRLIELKIEQKNNKNKNKVYKKQIEEIEKINNPLIQDSLILNKINSLQI